MARKVLVVDDDQHWLGGVLDILAGEGYDVRGAEGFLQGQRAIEQFHPDVLVVDIRLQQYNGLQLILECDDCHPDIVALVVSGYDDPVLVRDAKEAGAYDFLIKPIPAAVLVQRVGEALTSRGKRRWQRKPAPPGLTAIVSGHQARILDLSYGGILFELTFVPDVGRLDVRLPMLDRTLTAQPVWIRDAAPGVQLCGAALTIDDDEMTGAWRQLVDRMPRRRPMPAAGASPDLP